MNVVVNTIVQFLNIVLSLLIRRTFAETLGNDILGLNSLYASILGFITLSELGISLSISMCLYKPLAENDIYKINAYMSLLKKLYIFVGLLITFAGTLLIPFIRFFVDSSFNEIFLAISFELYVISTAVTYFFSYKKTLLGADQRSYIVSSSQAVYKIVLNVGQLAILIFYRNYYLYLIVAIICNVVENFVVSLICDKMYPYLKHKANPLEPFEKKDVVNKAYGMLCYKVGNYFIEGTDNIIISAFLGTAIVAFYNNYYLIINMLYSVFACVATSSIAGLGNIIYSDKNNINRAVSKLMLIQQYIFSFSSVAFVLLSSDFVTHVFADSQIFEFSTICLIAGVYYIKGYSQAIEAVRNGAGEYGDRYINLIVAIINIVLSIILIRYLGVDGVLIGTIVCYIIKEILVVPRIVYKKVIKIKSKLYYIRLFQHILLTLIIAFICMGLSNIFTNLNWVVSWLMKGVVCLIVSIIINTIAYFKSAEFRELYSYVLKH
jgi:O-antigen/teichoic acid export membrane protein